MTACYILISVTSSLRGQDREIYKGDSDRGLGQIGIGNIARHVSIRNQIKGHSLRNTYVSKIRATLKHFFYNIEREGRGR